MPYRKKLNEMALLREAINAASAREKSIRHGHPSTLHPMMGQATSGCMLYGTFCLNKRTLLEQSLRIAKTLRFNQFAFEEK